MILHEVLQKKTCQLGSNANSFDTLKKKKRDAAHLAFAHVYLFFIFRLLVSFYPAQWSGKEIRKGFEIHRPKEESEALPKEENKKTLAFPTYIIFFFKTCYV